MTSPRPSGHGEGAEPASDGRRRVELARAGLRLGDTSLPLLCGAMHYYQVSRQSWARCLDAICELGLPLVESYVPWAVHERSPGSYDFESPGDPSEGQDRYERDLGAFLEACAERGLRVLLRPGPHINGEMTHFGFPERVLRDERCLARGAAGNLVMLPFPPQAFPVPSYASDRFLDEAGTWLAAAGSFIAPYAWPQGPVVGAQVDNECCYFFRTAAYDQDYHPDAVARYREFLRTRYPEGLPPGYRAIEELEPPRSFRATSAGELAVHLDWVAFKEWVIVRALGILAGCLRGAGLDRMPLFHNFPGTDAAAASWSIAEVERTLDFAGLDFYYRREDYAALKRGVLLLSGSSRLPVLPELGCGGWPWWFPLSPEDQQATALAALMHGARGFNLYMTVERDRWFGSPIGVDGSRRPGRYEATRRLIAAVKGAQLPELEREVSVAVLQPRELDRLALCTALTDPLPPMGLSVLGLGPVELGAEEVPGLAGSVPREHGRIGRVLERALEQLQLPYHLVDAGVDAERLEPYRLLILPSFDFVDRALLEKLDRFVEKGGALALVPRRPTLGADLRSLDRDLPTHELWAEEELGARLEGTARRLGLAPLVRSDDPEIDLALYSAGDRPRVLFLANRSAQARRPRVSFSDLHGEEVSFSGDAGDPSARAWDALSGAPADLAGGISLGPHEVRMLRLPERGE